jgi:hypothetical protein
MWGDVVAAPHGVEGDEVGDRAAQVVDELVIGRGLLTARLRGGQRGRERWSLRAPAAALGSHPSLLLSGAGDGCDRELQDFGQQPNVVRPWGHAPGSPLGHELGGRTRVRSLVAPYVLEAAGQRL